MSLTAIKISELPQNLIPISVDSEIVVNIGGNTHRSGLNLLQNLSALNLTNMRAVNLTATNLTTDFGVYVSLGAIELSATRLSTLQPEQTLTLDSHISGGPTSRKVAFAGGNATNNLFSFAILGGQATGQYSNAQGLNARATGQQTVAIGEESAASSTRSVSFGFKAHSVHTGSAVINAPLNSLSPSVSSTRQGQILLSATNGVYLPNQLTVGTDFPALNAHVTIAGNLSCSRVLSAAGFTSDQWSLAYTAFVNNSQYLPAPRVTLSRNMSGQQAQAVIPEVYISYTPTNTTTWLTSSTEVWAFVYRKPRRKKNGGQKRHTKGGFKHPTDVTKLGTNGPFYAGDYPGIGVYNTEFPFNLSGQVVTPYTQVALSGFNPLQYYRLNTSQLTSTDQFPISGTFITDIPKAIFPLRSPRTNGFGLINYFQFRFVVRNPGVRGGVIIGPPSNTIVCRPIYSNTHLYNPPQSQVPQILGLRLTT